MQTTGNIYDDIPTQNPNTNKSFPNGVFVSQKENKRKKSVSASQCSFYIIWGREIYVNKTLAYLIYISRMLWHKNEPGFEIKWASLE